MSTFITEYITVYLELSCPTSENDELITGTSSFFDTEGGEEKHERMYFY